jgi:hypothetical protein
MKFRLLAYLTLFIFLTASSCKDDPEEDYTVELKDRKEQYLDVEKDQIQEYMQTHYYTLDAQYNVEIDTIDPAGSHTSIWDDPALQTLEVTDPKEDDLIYDLYYIPFRTGDNKQIHKQDNILVAYKGWLLNNKVFDEKIDHLPTWFYLPQLIEAWKEVIPNFKDGYYTDNGDGTITFDSYGAGMLITPSGLAYFNVAGKDRPAYSPLVFSFKTFKVDDDVDNDHVPNVVEDLNGNGDVYDDDTDDDKTPNIYDNDDDNDGVLTIDEDANGDGDPTNDDSDGDGIPDYLDSDTH